MGASRENVTSNNSSQCILGALKPTNVFLCGAKKQGIEYMFVYCCIILYCKKIPVNFPLNLMIRFRDSCAVLVVFH